MKKILIIDDEQSLLNIMSEQFASHHFTVLTAADGAQGLEVALANHPDVILLDILMPVMDGIQMLEKLRQDPWGEHVPVLVLTNVNDSASISAALNNRATKFYVKANWKLEDLIQEVEEMLAVMERMDKKL